jgi:Phospholipase_D-nuclease N-terminal
MYYAGFSGVFFVIFGCTAIFGILSSIFWIWMLIDCLTKEPDEGNSKLVWALVILFTHFIGAAIYYFVRRPERLKMYGR